MSEHRKHRHGDVQLEKGALPLIAVIAQSVGGMGVSSIVALLVPIVAITAGSGGWVAWTICTVLIIGVACCISALAKRITTTGGLYGLAAASLGPAGAFAVCWIVLILIGVGTLGTIIGFGIYFAQFIDLFGVGHEQTVIAISYFIALAVAWGAAYSGVKRSARVMMSVEAFAIVAILVLLVGVLVNHHGSLIDTRQLELHGASSHTILEAAVFAVLAFGGFESATVFGREARNPRRAIPVAMMVSVIVSGLLWIFAAYVLFLGYEGSGISLTGSQAPLHDLAKIAGFGWFGNIVDFAIAITLLSSMIALFNGLSRLMLTSSQEGIAPHAWSKLHPRHKTPSAALNTLGIGSIVILLVVVASDVEPLKAFSDFGDLTGLAYLTAYILMCVGTAMFLRRRGELRPWHVAVAAVSGLGLLYVFYSNLVPWPSAPDDVINAIALSVIVGSVLVYVGFRIWRPTQLEQIGATANKEDANAD